MELDGASICDGVGAEDGPVMAQDARGISARLSTSSHPCEAAASSIADLAVTLGVPLRAVCAICLADLNRDNNRLA
jgi:hypothetical protein